MGACCTSEAARLRSLHIEISEELEAGRRLDEGTYCILLLGSDSIGKSTVFKSMSVISDELAEVIKAETLASIRDNCVEHMLKVLQAMDEMTTEPLAQRFADEEKCDEKQTADHFSVLSECADENEEAVSELRSIGLAIAYFWALESVRRTHALRFGRFVFKENIEKFFVKAMDVFSDDYNVTIEDTNMVPRRVHGVVECIHKSLDGDIRIVDAGQRWTKRNKWFSFFDDIDAILFVAALDHFNCVDEDDVNCVHDSLSLQQFDECINHEVFSETGIILVLNNSKRFFELLKAGNSLSVCFGRDAEGWKGPEYWDCEAPQTCASLYDYSVEAKEFIRDRYTDKNMNTDREIFFLFTETADESIAQNVQEIVVNLHLIRTQL